MTSLWKDREPIVLASKSRTRQGLLATAGLPFEAVESGVDERDVERKLFSEGATAGEVAIRLARAKALAVGAAMPERLVLGADQTLVLDGRILSKPADRRAAIVQLELLSGRAHELCSGLCFARGKEVLFETMVVARLVVRELSASFIEAYAALVGDALLTSVGAYQIEGPGIHLFEAIEGDHSTILGLPLLPVLAYLRANGYLVA